MDRLSTQSLNGPDARDTRGAPDAPIDAATAKTNLLMAADDLECELRAAMAPNVWTLALAALAGGIVVGAFPQAGKTLLRAAPWLVAAARR